MDKSIRTDITKYLFNSDNYYRIFISEFIKKKLDISISYIFGKIIHRTEKAILILFKTKEIWIPKNQIIKVMRVKQKRLKL